jgi:hypothetical protein
MGIAYHDVGESAPTAPRRGTRPWLAAAEQQLRVTSVAAGNLDATVQNPATGADLGF